VPDNAFVRIADFARAQELADTLKPDLLHRHLERYAQLCCPVLDVFGQTYHWSLMQAEYSTDLVFKSEQIVRALYEQLSREAVLSVKAEHVATFLGKKLTPQLAAEIGSRLSARIEGTCIKHKFDSCSIKIYDKFARILRYLEFLCSLDDHSNGTRLLERITLPKPDGDRSFKGVNFFDLNDQSLLRAVQRPEFNIRGLARCDLMQLLPDLSPSTLPRQLRRLRVLGLITRAANTYRNDLTRTGCLAIAAFERLTTFAIVPSLANA
jgi:CRP-like cAMP-binding protein